MIKSCYILLVLSLLSISAFSQVFMPDMSVEQFDLIDANELLNSSNSIIEQIGNQNTMVVIQQQEGVLSNVIISKQYNAENDAYINQVGSGHASVLVQKGSGNEANLWSDGEMTVSKAWQQGDDNTIYSFIRNEALIPKVAALIQVGNRNNIELALTGNGFVSEGWPKAAFIEQKGNDLEVIAKLDSYDSPVLVRQQSGTSGEGMRVNISNSDFYFPMK